MLQPPNRSPRRAVAESLMFMTPLGGSLLLAGWASAQISAEHMLIWLGLTIAALCFAVWWVIHWQRRQQRRVDALLEMITQEQQSPVEEPELLERAR